MFILLQTLYQAFDEIAKKRKVFKVETIGDSYVACCGVPEAEPAHAVKMARFAWDCMVKMHEITRDLGTFVSILVVSPERIDNGVAHPCANGYLYNRDSVGARYRRAQHAIWFKLWSSYSWFASGRPVSLSAIWRYCQYGGSNGIVSVDSSMRVSGLWLHCTRSRYVNLTRQLSPTALVYPARFNVPSRPRRL